MVALVEDKGWIECQCHIKIMVKVKVTVKVKLKVKVDEKVSGHMWLL